MDTQTTPTDDGSTLYGEFNGGTQVRVRDWKGKKYVDIRKFLKGYPTKKGITIMVDALPDCISLLEKVESDLAKKA
jgi:hypothetical protein